MFNLNPQKSKNKAEAFKAALDIELKDAKYLKDAIYEAINLDGFKYLRTDKYGERYEQNIRLLGLNGKEANVKTGWIADKSGKKRLTSVYVDREKRK